MELKVINESLSKREKVNLAKKVLMHQVRNVGNGNPYDEYLSNFEDQEEAERIMYQQMLKVARALGLPDSEAYFG